MTNYNDIKVFGCKVFGFNPQTKKASPGIFTEYKKNPSAFKIFDIYSKRVEYSRVVQFYKDDPVNFYFYNQNKKKKMKITAILLTTTIIFFSSSQPCLK